MIFPGYNSRRCGRLLLTLIAMTPVFSWGYTARPADAGWLAAEKIFAQGELLNITITFDDNPTADPNVLVDCTTDTPHVATVHIRNSLIDEIVTTCGVRNKGNFTRCNPNRSWDISFDDLVEDRKFYGVDQLNLNAEPTDPTSSRSWLAWKLFAEMGIAASRCVPTSVTINGQYYGLQNCVEGADKGFMKAWFGDGNGIRFKCINNIADLAWRGPDRNAYDGTTNLGDGGQGYELKSKDLESDYARLIELIDFINNSTDEDFRNNITTHLDVDNFLRWLAVNMTIGSWDDYWNGSNNFGLYLPPGSTRWQWIAYDYDQCLGVGFVGINWARHPFDNRWKVTGDGFGTDNAPLTERMLAIPEYRDQFRRYVHKMRTGPFAAARLYPVIDEHRSLVLEAGMADPRDNFSAQQFADSFSQPGVFTPNWPTPGQLGLKPFITERNSYIAANLSIPSALPNIMINEVQSGNATGIEDEAGEKEDWIELHNNSANAVDLSGMYLSDDLTNPIKWRIPQGTTIAGGGKLIVWCDEDEDQGPLHASFKLSGDGEGAMLCHTNANLNVVIDAFGFPALLPDRSYGRYPDGSDNLVSFYLPTPGTANDNTSGPGTGETPRLFINEFSTSNQTIITDDHGEYEDYIEIYNDESEAVDMEGMHLTDNLGNPVKALIPAGVSIPPKGYLLFWADSEPDQGPTHLNFGLSNGGENIGLFDKTDNNYAVIDTIEFGPQTADSAEGRLPDAGPWGGIIPPTPGRSNSPAGVTGWELY